VQPSDDDPIERLDAGYDVDLSQFDGVLRIFPNQESCLRLIRALAAETHDGWLEEHRYLNLQFMAEQKKEEMRRLEKAA
jgi:transposase-like protein